jgi:hypothetical protein
MGVSSVKAVVVATVDFVELICAITRYAVATLGCDASNNGSSWENLAWIVVTCLPVPNSSASRMLGCWRQQRAISIRAPGAWPPGHSIDIKKSAGTV